jgi:hypothetical protein
MKTQILLLGFLITAAQLFAQNASDVLENSIKCREGNIYLIPELKEGIFEYSHNGMKTDFGELKDSNIFQIPESYKIYILALNPLNYSYSDTGIVKSDPIDQRAMEAMAGIFDRLNVGTGLAPALQPDEVLQMAKAVVERSRGDKVSAGLKPDLAALADKLVLQEIRNLQDDLETWSGEDLLVKFGGLKKMPYKEEVPTKNAVAALVLENEEKWKELKGIDQRITTMQEVLMAKMEATAYLDSAWQRNFMLFLVVERLMHKRDAGKMQLDEYTTVLNFVDKTINGWKSYTVDGQWFIRIESTSLERGKICLQHVRVFESGFALKELQIAKTPSREVLATPFRLRRLNAFVPEVAAGVFYTGLNYPVYGTATNAAGEMVVEEAKNESINRMNLAAALNITLNMPNSMLLPFFQLGAGLNTKVVPVVLVGAGIRSNISGAGRFAISGGIAMSWIQQLDRLKVGDRITGTAALDADLKYIFGSPKPYIGIQYNF